jgi:hypothetical protein
MEKVQAFDERPLEKYLADSQRQDAYLAAMASQPNLPVRRQRKLSQRRHEN